MKEWMDGCLVGLQLMLVCWVRADMGGTRMMNEFEFRPCAAIAYMYACVLTGGIFGHL